jgi:hypothetical protein
VFIYPALDRRNDRNVQADLCQPAQRPSA